MSAIGLLIMRGIRREMPDAYSDGTSTSSAGISSVSVAMKK